METEEEFRSFYRAVESILPKESNLEEALQSLGGSAGVIHDRLYVSALEEIGRYLVERLSDSQLLDAIQHRCLQLSEYSQGYFFGWAVVDSLVAARNRSAVAEAFIKVLPASYEPHLRREFPSL